MNARLAVATTAWLLCASVRPADAEPPRPSARAEAVPPSGASSSGPIGWEAQTFSPRPSATSSHPSLYAACGAPDVALARVARVNLERQAEGNKQLEADELAFVLGAAGGPYLWPRAWSLAGSALEVPDIQARMTSWAARGVTLGERRCGVVMGKAKDGRDLVSAVSVDVLADMEPLPTTARVGQWLTLKGSLRVPASGAKVVLLGPRGAPRTVLASLSDGIVRSSFSVDQPGPWVVQVLATVSAGPRPVLQAYVWAGSTPAAQFVRQAAPGERAGEGKGDVVAMTEMINAARDAEGVAKLVRDPGLDVVAREHAQAMLDKRMVAHDVGDGSPLTRVQDAGISVRLAGENVASAASLVGAHRAVWSSPSHRGNLLDPRFTRLGVSVLRDDAGRVWVTQMFGG